jgi:hypothetical protein
MLAVSKSVTPSSSARRINAMLSAIEDGLLNEPIRLQPSPSRGQAAWNVVEGWGEIDNMLKARPFLELSLLEEGAALRFHIPFACAVVLPLTGTERVIVLWPECSYTLLGNLKYGYILFRDFVWHTSWGLAAT